LATWEARRQRVKERTGNGNGFGTPLAIAIQLWPKAETPRTAGQLNPAFVEILMGLPVGWTDLDVPNDALAAWPGWPSAPGEEQMPYEPTRTGTGIPQRSKRLECLGNACVPQQAALLFAAIADVDAGLVALATGTAAQDARGRL